MSQLRAAAVAAWVAAASCFVSPPVIDAAGADVVVGDATPDVLACPAPPGAGDLPCDVSAVFRSRCQKCHTLPKPAPPDNGPFPLRSYENLWAPFGTTSLYTWQRVSQVIEPNNFPHMPPPTEPQLIDSDFATLRAWFDACAPGLPEGTGCDVGEGDAGLDASADVQADGPSD